MPRWNAPRVAVAHLSGPVIQLILRSCRHCCDQIGLLSVMLRSCRHEGTFARNGDNFGGSCVSRDLIRGNEDNIGGLVPAQDRSGALRVNPEGEHPPECWQRNWRLTGPACVTAPCVVWQAGG